MILEEQQRAALSKYRAHRLEESELEEEMVRAREMKQNLDETVEALSSQMISSSDKASQLEETLLQHGAGLERKRSHVQLLLQNHRDNAQVPPGEKTLLELEVQMMKQQSANYGLVDGLSQLAAKDTNLAAALEREMAANGVHPPSQPDDGDDGYDEGGDLLE